MSGNEKFLTAVLYVVTVSYVAFCCLILGWLFATEPSWIEALVKFGGIYGTLLAGVPVIIAVLVAKQQLDAMRRQHRSNVKMATIDRLNAVKISKTKMQTLSQWNISDSLILHMKDKNIPVFIAFDNKSNEYLQKHLSPTLYNIVMIVDKHFCSIYPMLKENNSMPLETVRAIFEIGQNLAKDVLGQLEVEENEICRLAV